VHGVVNSHKLAIGSNDSRLLRKKFLPAETGVLEALLKWKPHTLLPAQAALDSIAILHQRFFNLLAHVARMRRAESCYLTIPARAEFLAKTLQTEELPKCLKMFRKARAGAVDSCCVEELAPGFVREQNDQAQFPTALEMPEYFASDMLLILCHYDTGSFRPKF